MKDFSPLFLKHKNIILILIVFLFGFINAWVDSISTQADLNRNGVEVLYWEPYSWSFSSFVLTFGLIFFIAKVQKYYPLSYRHFQKNFVFHLLFSLLFSLAHVIGMVLLRKAIYMINDKTYDFGYWPTELLYEYRKDVLSYFIILSGIYIYKMIIKQIQGEASLISEGGRSNKKTDKLLVKKKGKEFIINFDQVSTIASGGNYVYIHANKQVYPMRSTMNKMAHRLDAKQFIRVHRSYIVNLNHIREIISPAAQEYTIITKDNSSIPLSRKYRAHFLDCFNN